MLRIIKFPRFKIEDITFMIKISFFFIIYERDVSQFYEIAESISRRIKSLSKIKS